MCDNVRAVVHRIYVEGDKGKESGRPGGESIRYAIHAVKLLNVICNFFVYNYFFSNVL